MSDLLHDLRTFLWATPDPNLTQPPPIPARFDQLPPQDYINLASDYVDDYPFNRTITVFQHETPRPFTPDAEWSKHARKCVKACINVGRDGLSSIQDNYDASDQQQRFIHQVLFKSRWQLEEFALGVFALLKLICFETIGAYSWDIFADFFTDSEKINEQTVATMVNASPGPLTPVLILYQVNDRDVRCRLTGAAKDRIPSREECEEREAIWARGERTEVVASMEVAHGLPVSMGSGALSILTALTGIQVDQWHMNCVENAFMVRMDLQRVFGSFGLYLDWCPDNQIVIRGRSGKGDQRALLASVCNDRCEPCSAPGALLDTPLRPRGDTSIADIDKKFFVLHKYIGDIAWEYGHHWPGPADEEEEGMLLTNDFNIDEVVEILKTPCMDFLSREGEWGKRWAENAICM